MVYIVDGNNQIIGRNVYEYISRGEFMQQVFDERAIINGQELLDGGIVKTDFMTGEISVVDVNSVNETRAFVSTTGISNGTADQVDRTLAMSTNAYSEGYDRTYHVANVDGNVDKAAETLSALMRRGVFRDGGAIVGHSQAAVVVGRALDLHQKRIAADVYMYGGAQYVLGPYGTTPGEPKRKSIRTHLVRNCYNYWNTDDQWAYYDKSKQKDLYTDNSKVKDFINGETGNWKGSGHGFDGGYDEAYEKCFQHIENCK